MCGLSGFARTDGGPLAADSEDVLRRMAQALAHRGPDDEQILVDASNDRVGLAFTRLALMDPEGGRQPFVGVGGKVALCANGEVYNYREIAARLPAGTLRSGSDCEVLLPLYLEHGARFLEHARGMLAVAVYDARTETLVLARDRLGIKPLFFTRVGPTIAFASEIKALFEHPGVSRRLNWQQALADQALAAAAVLPDSPPVTWFEGVEQVEPGTTVEVDLRTGATRVTRWWTMPEPAADGPSDAEYAARYRELLVSSVDECLVADAEIGLFLSGGIDSAAVAALSARTGLHTFSAMSASTVANGDAENASLVAASLGLPNHQVLFPAERIPTPTEWKRLLWLLETPQCGPEQFYKHELHRFAKASRPGLKAILLGSGADELNGGYTGELSGGGDWDDFLANVRVMARRRSLAGRPAPLATWWDADLPLLTDEALVGADDALAAALADPYRAYLAWKWRDLQQYNFWHEDRTSAGNAIEARVPFLDHRIVELLGSIPADRRRSLLWNKQIIRSAMADVLPPEILQRPKVAFYEGDGAHHTYRAFVRMLARDGGALLDEALSSPGAAAYLDADNARETLRRLEGNPRASHVEHLLRVVNLGLLELMTVAPPPPNGPVPFTEPLREVPVTDWDESRDEVELLTVGRTELSERDVPRLGADVMVLDSPVDGRTSYIVIAGSLEYVVDAEGGKSWLQFLRAVDGRRDLGEIAVETGEETEAIRPLIEEAVALGILAFSTGD